MNGPPYAVLFYSDYHRRRRHLTRSADLDFQFRKLRRSRIPRIPRIGLDTVGGEFRPALSTITVI